MYTVHMIGNTLSGAQLRSANVYLTSQRPQILFFASFCILFDSSSERGILYTTWHHVYHKYSYTYINGRLKNDVLFGQPLSIRYIAESRVVLSRATQTNSDDERKNAHKRNFFFRCIGGRIDAYIF